MNQNPEEMLKMKELVGLLKVCSRTIYRMIADGRFPKPLKIGRRNSRWLLSDVRKYLNGLNGGVAF